MKLKKIDITELQQGESYLVVCPKFSESGYDIATLENGELISQSNGDDFLSINIQITAVYLLP